jgi:hypothetical protein
MAKSSTPIQDQAAFWQLPLASLSDLARVLGTSPQQLGKIDLPRVKFGGQTYVRPAELAQSVMRLGVSE